MGIPPAVDRQFFMVRLGANPCPANRICQGPKGTKFATSINVSLLLPTTGLLQARYLRR